MGNERNRGKSGGGDGDGDKVVKKKRRKVGKEN